MAWGQEKGADFHISALRACQYEIFDFVPCSLPLKTLILLTFSCFLIRRRGKRSSFFILPKAALPLLEKACTALHARAKGAHTPLREKCKSPRAGRGDLRF